MLNSGFKLGNRYEVIKLLGRGGQSNIYLLKDLHLKGKKWVCKEMAVQYSDPRDQALAKKHFEQEAQMLATLEHINLPKVNDYFVQGGKHYLIMEYIEGEDLGRMIEKAKKPFREEQVANWASQVATVLYYLHCHKPPIVFRDIKPSNIMICGGQVKLIDFGIARRFSPAKKGDTLRIGSPGYSPPEQYSGQTDPRSDIYSLGITMHHLLTGYDPSKTQTPFNLPPIKALNSNVSTGMIFIVEKATHLDPTKRYQTAIEMKKDIQSILKQGKIPPPSGVGVPTIPHISGVPTTPTLPPPFSGYEQAPSTKFMSGDLIRKEIPGKSDPFLPPEEAAAPKAIQSAAAKISLKKIVGFILMLFILTGLTFATSSYWQDMINIFNLSWRTTPIPTPVSTAIKPFEEGIILYKQGKYKEALDYFKQLWEKDRKSPEILIYVNNCYTLAGESETLKIGVLSQDLGDLDKGDMFLRGAALSQQRINFEGGLKGRKIILNFYRLSEDFPKNKSIITQAFEDGHVALIVRANGDLLRFSREKASNRKVALLSSETNDISPAGISLTRRMTNEFQMNAIATYFGSSNIKRIVVVHDPYFGVQKENFDKSLSNTSVKIDSTFAYQRDKLDFDPILMVIKDKAPDGIVVLGRDKDLIHFIKALRRANLRTPVFLPAYLTTFGLLASLKDQGTGLIGITPLDNIPANYRMANFINLFNDCYEGVPPDLKAAYGYDLLNMIAFAGRKSSPDGAGILSNISLPGEWSAFECISGVCDDRGEAAPSWWAVVKAADGKWVKIGGFQVQ